MKFAATKALQRMSGELVLSFFIHGQGTDLQKTPLGIYRALLNSMLENFPEYLSQLTTRFEDQEKRLGGYMAGRWEWDENELQEFLSIVLTKGAKHQRVVIFVDALDECGEGPAKALLAYFKDLMQDVERQEAQVKICFSSRHYPILGLETVPTVSVERRNDKDIQWYIHERLKDMRPIAKRQQIGKEIFLKAQGGFQWVFLVTEIVISGSLKGIQAEKLREKLVSTPEALFELYGTILRDVVAETEQRQMVKLFQWVLFAGRPLSAQELRDALATDEDMRCTTVSELRNHESWNDTLVDFERHVRYLSRGLIEFQTREIWEQYEPDGEDPNREAQLIHQSVADYLLDKFLKNDGYRQHDFRSQEGAGHFQISRSCLKYLTLREVLEGSRLPRSTLSSKFPLAPYATRFVFEHIRKVEQEGIAQIDLLTLFQWDVKSELLGRVVNLWAVFDPDRLHTPIGWPFIGATALHFLIALGSKSALDVFLLENDIPGRRKDSDGNTPLLLAARECHPDMALVLMRRTQENEIDSSDEDGRTPLSWAAGNGQDAVVKLLLETDKVDIDSMDQEGLTPLWWATRNGQEATVKLLLDTEKVDVKSKDQEGLTPLLWATRNGQEATVKLLLDTDKIDIDIKDHWGLTSLWWAAKNRHEAIVKLLLDTDKVDVNIKDREKRTPLWWATRNGQEATVKLLLDTDKVDVNIKDQEGLTPLLWAAQNEHEAIVKLLLDIEKVDVDSMDQEGLTPLWWATCNGQEAIVKLLLDTDKVDVNIKDREKRTPLWWAARNGQEATVKLLLDIEKVDVDSMDQEGLTPLWWATCNGQEAIVKLLLDTDKVDVNIKDCEKRTPLWWAARNGQEATVKLLLDTEKVDVESEDQEGLTPLLWAAQNGYEAIVKLLLDTDKIDIDIKDHWGLTSLWWAAQNGHEAIVKLLLDTDKVDVNIEDREKRTPLLWAAQKGHEAIVKLLLDIEKVDVGFKDHEKRTPLWWAARNGYEATVKLLLDTNKVDVDFKDQNGRTPLWWATRNGHEAIVKLLLDTDKVDVDSMNQEGRMPL
jgi:ankyrin repeat protein